MNLDPASCYRALKAHDVRFDGVFFIAVKTTGVYCRPICPARVPGAGSAPFDAVGEAELFRCGCGPGE